MYAISAPSSTQIQVQRFFFRTDKLPLVPITHFNHHSLHNIKENGNYNLQSCFRVSAVDSNSEQLPSTRQLFDEIPVSDTFAWNNLIQTHLSNGDSYRAVLTYGQMLVRGVRPDKHTLPRILTASRLSRALSFGKQVHGQALKLGLSTDHYIVTALMELYGRLDRADAARWLFEKSPRSPKNSVVAWTMLAKMYVMQDKPRLAIDLFNRTVESGDVDMDSVALATAIGACGLLKSLQEGRNVHRVAREHGLEFDVLVSNSLLKMYNDCGSLRDAQAVFDRMPSKDAISWTEMLGGYVKKGGFNEGLKLFRQMNLVEGIRSDSLAISSILPACARVAAHKNGKEIHGYLVRNGIQMNLTVQNALMDMYVKSGSIEYASRIFTWMKDKDTISWTVMILGHSFHGHGELGVAMFREMEKTSSEKIDQTMYVAVLYACCTARLVEDGRFYFSCIKAPQVAHYALMVALLARSGLFDEAKTFIEERNLAQHAEVLRALLDGCRIYQNTKTGKRVIEQLCDLEPLNADNYVLLSNWYAHNAKWDMVNELKETITDMGLRPRIAYSWIEFQNKVHSFETGDVSHPRSEKIYWELQSLMKKLDEEGFRPKSDFSLHDINEERECMPIGHSEMLAISLGLVSTQAGTTIRVAKNLRMCRSCHDSTRFISKLVDREIIIKDQSCFHHFKDGFCSCGDF
ncbi:pentatricopeptide repeat-containing protein DOT4, chloroplastic-like [Actinidia eriantha]|uniref:pentatricopeptide repeat-containing protein DOT4, chloroplastic-like n=1 Tax=Actinidia eriantha TaxID=165200 RepID=UPI00258DAB03|nr:pentatricopeptide repeat-containing protein DOT4, chloroplastic-like [Actinidia eriantha]